MAKGRVFTDDKVRRIVHLLATTDVPIGEIAIRFGCSRTAISKINRKARVRLYGGRKIQWIVSSDNQTIVRS